MCSRNEQDSPNVRSDQAGSDNTRIDNTGFTLLEIMVALGMLSVLLSLTTTFFMFNLQNNMKTQIRQEAIQAAQTILDDLRFQDTTTLGSLTHQDVVIGDRTYSVDVSYCSMNEFCISDDIRHVAIEVKYKTEKVYATDTVFAKF